MPSSYFTNSWMYGEILISCDWICSLVLRFLGRLPQIFAKFDRALIHRLVITKWCYMKMGKYSFNRGIIALHFRENMQVSVYPIWRKCGRHTVQVSDEACDRLATRNQFSPTTNLARPNPEVTVFFILDFLNGQRRRQHLETISIGLLVIVQGNLVNLLPSVL